VTLGQQRCDVPGDQRQGVDAYDIGDDPDDLSHELTGIAVEQPGHVAGHPVPACPVGAVGEEAQREHDTADGAVTKAQGAVIATKPASAPLATMDGSGFPYRSHM
jgi:hypothetical protein